MFNPNDWSIDLSTSRPILMYQKCSVIEAETAYAVLQLVRESAAESNEPVAYVSPGQLERFSDSELPEVGRMIPMRKSPGGLFSQPLYALSTKPAAPKELPSVDLLEVCEEVHTWMDNQSDAQSKGGHATFDHLMLTEQREALRSAIDRERHRPTGNHNLLSTMVENVAKCIYKQWHSQDGYTEWMDGGNSNKQEEARDLARAALVLSEGNPWPRLADHPELQDFMHPLAVNGFKQGQLLASERARKATTIVKESLDHALQIIPPQDGAHELLENLSSLILGAHNQSKEELVSNLRRLADPVHKLLGRKMWPVEGEETKAQVAAVMLTGTPEQQRQAVDYFSGKEPK